MIGREMERPEAATEIETGQERPVAAIGTGTGIGPVTGKTVVTVAPIAKERVAAGVQLRPGRHFLLQHNLPTIVATAEDWRSSGLDH